MIIKKLDNYTILFCLRILKSILNNFVDVFLVLYFLTISNSNIIPLGIYKLVAVISIWLVMFFTRNYCKSKGRIKFLRLGIILYFLYFLTIIILREKIVDYIYIIGVLYGVEEGFYYCVYNMIESDGVANEDRTKYIGSYTFVKNIITILFPILFGYLIGISGFINATICALMIVILQLALSFAFKDKNIPKRDKMALEVTRFGFNIYKIFWNLYRKQTKRK